MLVIIRIESVPPTISEGMNLVVADDPYPDKEPPHPNFHCGGGRKLPLAIVIMSDVLEVGWALPRVLLC